MIKTVLQFLSLVPILCKISKKFQLFDQNFHMSCGSWVMTQNMSRRKFSTFSQSPKKKHENEAKMKVTMIILGISFVLQILHVWHLYFSSNTAKSLPISPYLNIYVDYVLFTSDQEDSVIVVARGPQTLKIRFLSYLSHIGIIYEQRRKVTFDQRLCKWDMNLITWSWEMHNYVGSYTCNARACSKWWHAVELHSVKNIVR